MQSQNDQDTLMVTIRPTEESKQVVQRRATWESCCLRMDRQAMVYFSQFAFSLGVFGFSAIMLVIAKGDCDRSSPYIGLISFLLGKFLSNVIDSTK